MTNTMRSLALLIAAATGANAVATEAVDALLFQGNKYTCATGCQGEGLFIGEQGTCHESDAVVQLGQDGRDVHRGSGIAFTCARSSGPDGQPSWRQRKAGETPPQCETKSYKDTNEVRKVCPTSMGLLLSPDAVKENLSWKISKAEYEQQQQQQQQEQEQQQPSQPSAPTTSKEEGKAEAASECKNLESWCERRTFVTLKDCKNSGTDSKVCRDAILRMTKLCKERPQLPKPEDACKEEEARCEREAFGDLNACSGNGPDLKECIDKIITDVESCKAGQ